MHNKRTIVARSFIRFMRRYPWLSGIWWCLGLCFLYSGMAAAEVSTIPSDVSTIPPEITPAIPSLTLYTQLFPPLQMMSEGDTITGFVAETVREMLQEARKDTPLEVAPITVIPWKRALFFAEKESNVLVFSLSRTPEREDKYIWIGTVAPYSLSFYKLRSREDIQASNEAELKGKGYRIGSQIGSSMEEYLKRHGFGEGVEGTVVDSINENQRNIPRLYRGYIDLIMFSDYSIRHRACDQGLNPNVIEKLFTVPELSTDLWLVASKQTDEQLIVKLQQALEKVKNDGRHERLMAKYFAQWQQAGCP